MYLNVTMTLLFACLMASTGFAQLEAPNGTILFRGTQYLSSNTGAGLIWKSNHSIYTQLVMRDKENVTYGSVFGGGNGLTFGLLDGDGNWSYQARKDQYTAFRINNSEKMRILANGNVGIGVTNPQARLQMHLPSGVQGLAVTGPSGNTHIPFIDGRVYLSGLEVVFRTDGNNERMRVAVNGNVGIGTASPANKLDVNGTIRAKEILVEESWGDYVFYDDYQLPTLEEEAAHIDTKGHLTGFESAEDMAGQIQLGDVSKRQQVKIEEIILHLIDMNEKIEKIEAENAELKAQLEADRK